MNRKNIFILDTNVLLHDPQALFAFKHETIGIPLMVLEELDHFKSEATNRGYSARRAIRTFDELRNRGHLVQGVALDNGGTLRVYTHPDGAPASKVFKDHDADNLILATCAHLKEEGWEVHFVSKDLNARVKADILGIQAQDYTKGQVSQEEIVKGWITIPVPAVQLKQQMPAALAEALSQFELDPNTFIILESQHNPFNFRIFRYLQHKNFKEVLLPHLRWPLGPKNPQQIMALDLMLDPDIQFVSLVGRAGTGKTFLALLAGLHQVVAHDDFQRILVSRPIVPLGPDIGFLPGTLDEKLHNWMQPIYDNMDYIVHAAAKDRHLTLVQDDHHDNQKGKNKHEHHKKRSGGSLPSLDELIHTGKISLEAITYMRGRSIPYQFIIIDEAQNLTPHEIKTIISRVGEGSKIVICGDPYQIDSPYLDFSSNGLVVASNNFKGQLIFGTVFLETSERSELSRLASELL